MNEAAVIALWVYILVFCRVGTAFILLPGFAGLRLPMTVRLFTALLVTVAITPLLFTEVRAAMGGRAPVPAEIFSELAIGLAFGFWCFCFLQASRFAAHVISASIGLAGIPGQPIEDQEPAGQLAALLSLAATMLIFSADLHLMSLGAIVRSYESMPVFTIPGAEWMGLGSVRIIRDTSFIAIQIAGPFMILGVIINLGLGLCGKFTPQLQIYFAFVGLTIIIALLAMALLAPNMLQIPVQAYASWLSESLQ